MKKMYLNSLINAIMFLYILSLYLLTYREGLNTISNALALLLVTTIWANFLLTKRKLIFNKLLLVYLLFVAICTTSIFFALDQNIALSKVITLTLIYIVMVSFVNYTDSDEKLKKVIVYFVYSGFIASIYVILSSDFSNITRFGSELGNVNAMGMIIGISATFCVYLVIGQKRYFYSLFLLAMIPVILLTGSRKSLLFILVNILIITYLKNRRSFKNNFRFIIVGILVLILMYILIVNVPLFYKVIGKRMENVFNFLHGENVNEGALYTRIRMTMSGLEMFKDKPFIGYGINNYRVLYGDAYGGRYTYAHNNYIELMVGVGIFGAIVYYLTHIFVLIDLYKCSKNAADDMICLTFIAIIISYIILAPTLVYYDSKHFNFLLAVASIIIRIARRDKADSLEQNTNRGQVNI